MATTPFKAYASVPKKEDPFPFLSDEYTNLKPSVKLEPGVKVEPVLKMEQDVKMEPLMKNGKNEMALKPNRYSIRFFLYLQLIIFIHSCNNFNVSDPILPLSILSLIPNH